MPVSRTRNGEEQRALLLTFIEDYAAAKGYPPQIVEMSEASGLSRTAVNWHLDAMRELGQVSFIDGQRARTLQLARRRRPATRR